MSTQFGWHPQSSSPAAKRIADAGYRYTAARERAVQKHIETERALESAEAARIALDIKAQNVLLRRWRIIDRFERAFQLVRDLRVPREITMAQIIKEVADAHGLTVPVLRSRRRSRYISRPRQEAMWRCHTETSHTLNEIARFFGGFDHTTVMHAIKAHEGRIK